MTIETAAGRLVAEFNKKGPRNIQGVHSVWIRTNVVEGQFVRMICVALNDKDPRIGAFVAGMTVPTEYDGYQVDRVPWPTGPQHDVIAAYEDGSLPEVPAEAPSETVEAPAPVSEPEPRPEPAPRRPARAEPLAIRAKAVTKTAGKPIVKAAAKKIVKAAAKRVVYPARKPPRRK